MKQDMLVCGNKFS